MVSCNVQAFPNYMKEFPPARLRAIRKALARWYEASRRDLPWRRTRDPYRVWISEIMLQQTRVAAVIPYYHRFLDRFPSVEALAAAGDDELLAAWAGLGYYSRARNLREAARRIAALGGFPQTHPEILALPGIGPYTAAAVASIAFDLPFAVLDGNVMRVLARLTHDDGDIGAPSTRTRMQLSAQRLLDPANAAVHNQAMMELGATICLPREPKCEFCPVLADCAARAAGLERQLPVKLRKVEIRRVRRTLLAVIRDGQILLWQRSRDAAMLGGFWELPEPHQLPEATHRRVVCSFSHAITNHIYEFQVERGRAAALPGLLWMPLAELSSLPLSTVARKALAGIGILA
jgi:A/G-specific adenine glycosylase